MNPSVYIETSIVSYLVARPSRDAVMAERQRQTREWWEHRREEFRLFTSTIVVDEISNGEALMAHARAAAVAGVAVLEVTTEVTRLAAALVTKGPLPRRAEPDAHHIAIATVNRLDYLLTWDRKHLANPWMFRKIAQVCRERGFEPPVLCTPDAL